MNIEFDYFNIRTSNFPNKEIFIDNLQESLIESKKLDDQTTADFFNHALEMFKEEYIPFVRISDFNTNGLRGSALEESSDWNNLVKSSGISDKTSGAGGSFWNW